MESNNNEVAFARRYEAMKKYVEDSGFRLGTYHDMFTLTNKYADTRYLRTITDIYTWIHGYNVGKSASTSR